MERTLWRKIRDKNIKLYTKDNILPNWAKHRFFNIENERHTKEAVDITFSWALRSYQVEGLYHIFENNWGLIEAKTWSWKSFIIMGIASFYKKKTLIICPTKKLVKEMYDKFKEFTSYEVWTYYSDWKNIKDITITTHMSFVKDSLWKKELGKYDVIIIDEADDRLSKNMIDSICYSDCNILVGLSWTPDRQELDINDMQLIFWPHIKIWEYQMKPTSITHYIYKRSPWEVAMIDYTNWHYQRETMLANNHRFEAVVEKIWEICENNFLSLLLLDRMSEIEKYMEMFPEAIVITGKTKIADDEKNINEIVKKWWLIIGSIKKMYRWVDIPRIDNVIVASPIRFENTVIQAVGRSLREHEDKKTVNISIINDDVLKSQRYEQTKAVRKEYSINPTIEYLSMKK